MYKQLAQDEADSLISAGNVVVADVRDEDSYKQGHIEGAIHLTMSTLQEFCDNNDKNTAILVYCFHGISSQSVAQHLIDQGFAEVYSLSGGYEAWKKARRLEGEDER